MGRKIQKIMFLLSVSILILTGCNGQEKEDVTEAVIAIGTNDAQENDVTEKTEKDDIDSEMEEREETDSGKSDKEEQTGSSVETNKTEQQGRNTEQQNERSGQSQQTTASRAETATQESSNQEDTEAAPSEPAQPSETVPISYSPQRVVELAVEKTKAQGKIYIPDDLNQMLAAGEISQEDYNASYPTDGAGYLEYYVATDMNEARDISGTVQFSSEADIAANIAGMYASLPQQYFYIEYHGTATYGGEECYVFYCYRA